jgi:proton-dependent oligopeptide transporter, POT family
MNPSDGLLRSYPRVFWVANVMELFERAAYYGLNSVLAIYLTLSVAEGGLGFTEQSVGFLQGLIYACTYIVPILGGALADRYGYRRMLLVAFSLLSSGYFLSGNMSGYGTVFAALLVMATGAGLFKPIISGTIARSTNEKSSGFGFGIYYWMINLGAFLAPLIVSAVKGLSWNYVFGLSSAYCALMLIPSLFLYRDPPKPENTRTIAEVLKGAALVLGDARFMLMIFVYSGFWILYFQNFGTILWFLRDFIDPRPVNALFASIGISLQFDAEHVTVINAGTIILLQVLVSRAVRNVAPLKAMVGGMGIGALGFICLAFASTPWIFILGIAVFSVGEMTAHPKYYSYIGLVAPAETKAVYMGYAFLYGVIGSLIGSTLGGSLYELFLKPLVGTPDPAVVIRNFWLGFALLGGVAAAGLLAYNRFFSADTPVNNRRAEKAMLAIYGVVLLAGAYFGYSTLTAAGPASYRTLVQAAIMVVLGGLGLAVTLRRERELTL